MHEKDENKEFIKLFMKFCREIAEMGIKFKADLKFVQPAFLQTDGIHLRPVISIECMGKKDLQNGQNKTEGGDPIHF